MKAAVYNPYLDTLGGGERYTLDFTRVLMENDYNVHVQWKDKKIKNVLEERFGMDLEKLQVVENINRGDGYDICFWLSDGSIPLLRSRKNILHFQHPFRNVNGSSLLNKMKLYRINYIVCNSNFTKKFIDKEYSVNSTVIYPAIDLVSIKPKRKQNLILSVGRFSQLEQAKRQDVLIKVFRNMIDKGLENWKLIIAGGVEVGVSEYLNELKEAIKGYPIELMESPNFSKLVELYGVARIFWSASGFGIDENEEPKKVEHFGITLVEAMAAKGVPVVYNAGGHKEIIKNEVNGYLWDEESMLEKLTLNLIDDDKLCRKISSTAKMSSENFSYEIYREKVQELL